MKKIISLTLLILLCIATKAQNINTTIAQDINTVFQPIEKNRIPHQMLLDASLDLIDVTAYDGVLRNDNYMSMSKYTSIYNTMVSSTVVSGLPGIASPTLEQEQWRDLQIIENTNTKLEDYASVVLNGALFTYSKINENALANNKIQVVNGQYDDKYINGIWQNPYDEKLTFAIAAPILFLNKAEVRVKLPATLWHYNTSTTNIDINFGDGTGYKNIKNGITASTTYTNTGFYTWTFRVRLSNGLYKYCRQKIKINDASLVTQARNPSCPIQIEPIAATKAFQGVFGSATVQIAYGSTDCLLRKPLIVAEGFDTSLLAQAGSIGDSDYDTFFQAVLQSNSTDLRNLIINDTAIDYDIVYVNWDNGTDFIQRNAYVLEAVIDWVNNNKVGNAQNVVLGQSMGGLIARYALRDMENSNETHDTSLYISHDAPHQGAHIPLGALYMGRHVVDQFAQTAFVGDFNIPITPTSNITLSDIGDLLNKPALQQMLINNVNDAITLDNIVHNNWQNELENMGYPQQTRNIALSNANHCAEVFDLTPNQILLELTGEGYTSGLSDILMFFSFTGPLVGDFLDDTETFLLGFLPGNSKVDVEFRVRAFPSSGNIAQIYRGRLTYTKKLLWVLDITRTVTNISKSNPSNTLSLDYFPGGGNPSTTAIEASNYSSNLFYGTGFSLSLNLDFSFIQAVSALDVGSGNVNLSDFDYLKTYTTTNPPTGIRAIPFDNFSTSHNQTGNNEPHISFNRRNGDWLATELDLDTTNQDDFDCTLFCSNGELVGDDFICDSSTYSPPINADFANWTITSGSSLVTTSISGNSITITQANSNNNGYITLETTYGNSKCGIVNLSKQIWVGTPNVTNYQIYGGDDNVPINSTSQLNVDYAEGIQVTIGLLQR